MRDRIENINYINLFNSIVYGWTLHTQILSLSKQSKCGCYFLGDDKVSVYERVTTCGLCNYKEKNTSFHYCDENYKDIYPCAPGVAYYGRGDLPIYWYLPYQ